MCPFKTLFGKTTQNMCFPMFYFAVFAVYEMFLWCFLFPLFHQAIAIRRTKSPQGRGIKAVFKKRREENKIGKETMRTIQLFLCHLIQ